MNSSQSIPSAAAEDQAALWAAKIDGSSLNGSDHDALATWLAASPAHRGLLSHYCQFSADLEERIPALVATGAVAMPPIRKSFRPRVAWIAGMGLAAAAAFALMIAVRSPRVGPETHVTAVAQRQSLTLADGTRMELNAHTSILVENGPKERRVRLASGEAFFNVSKDRARPFIVETPAGSVRVTGTIFNVRSEATSQLEVTVVEGSVDVHPGGTAGNSAGVPVALKAGDRVSAEAGTFRQTRLSAGALEDALAWRRGQIVFDEARLEEAVARFARYHGRAVKAVGPAANLLVGGTYTLDDFDGFLAALPRLLPGLQVVTDLSGAVIVSLPAGG